MTWLGLSVSPDGQRAEPFRYPAWTYARIVKTIQHRYKIRYHPDHIRRLFKLHGLNHRRLRSPRPSLSVDVLPTLSPTLSPVAGGSCPDPSSCLPLGNMQDGAQAQELHSRSFFPEADVAFDQIEKKAGKNVLLKAEIAWRRAWNHYSQGNYEAAQDYVWESISLIKTHLDFPPDCRVADMLASARHVPHSVTRDTALTILCQALHVSGKSSVEQAKYWGKTDSIAEAELALRECLDLAISLDEWPLVGHTRLWLAILHSGLPTHDAKEHLQKSAGLFAGALGHVYSQRTQGILQYCEYDLRGARRSLLSALEQFADFGDARAMGPTFHLVSRAATRAHDYDSARRYAIVGALVHPYGFVLERLRDVKLLASEINGIVNSDRHVLDALRASKRNEFRLVHRVTHRLVDGDEPKMEALLRRNLSKIVRFLNPDFKAT